ncbi:MAG: Gfo/Idh/MocA family protein, partial [Blastocatellia bacterium]
MSENKLDRRTFVKSAVGAGAALSVLSKTSIAGNRIIGANDRVNLALIGCGGRGRDLLKWAMDTGKMAFTPAEVVAVCDVYAKRKRIASETAKCDGFSDYREILARKDIDAVIIATPDHWHGKIALEALEKGKDVYLEKPMTHTIEEARLVTESVERNKRVLQVGSQTTSSDQWWKAKKAIQDGMIGKMIMSQGSYHRNSRNGEWNW